MIGVVSPDGRLRLGPHVYRVALGRGGVRADKQEGDGATPAGLLPLRRVLYRADRVAPPACAVPIEPLAPDDGWCDDPAEPAYNRPVRLPYAGSHEELWRPDALYDLIGVLGWNDSPPARGRGSAIFLHVARPDFAPTEGCIALAPADLAAVFAAGLTEILVRDRG
ncbi:MAG: L,D-transpeptidase family protein [Acetobacteraceae bacterium]